MQLSRRTARPSTAACLLMRARCRLSTCAPWPPGRPSSRRQLLVSSPALPRASDQQAGYPQQYCQDLHLFSDL